MNERAACLVFGVRGKIGPSPLPTTGQFLQGCIGVEHPGNKRKFNAKVPLGFRQRSGSWVCETGTWPTDTIHRLSNYGKFSCRRRVGLGNGARQRPEAQSKTARIPRLRGCHDEIQRFRKKPQAERRRAIRAGHAQGGRAAKPDAGIAAPERARRARMKRHS